MNRPDHTSIVCICLAAILAIVAIQWARAVFAQETVTRAMEARGG